MELSSHELDKLWKFAETIIRQCDYRLEHLSVRYDLEQRFKEAKEIRGLTVDDFVSELEEKKNG